MGEITPGDVARLARAVVGSDSTAILIAPDNRRIAGPGGFVSVPDAVASGRAFMVKPRDGVLVLDIDSRDDAAWAQSVLPICTDAGCRVVRVTSGRAGHEHMWVVGRVGWGSLDLQKLVQSLGEAPPKTIRQGQHTRPPCSPHREGGHGHLIEPRDVDQAVAALATPVGAVPLSVESLALLRHGDRTGRYVSIYGEPSRTTLTYALAIRYVNAGLPREQLAADLMTPANKAGEKYRLQGSRGPAWLMERWEAARLWVRDNPPKSPGANGQSELRAVLQTAADNQWGGRTATTDRATYSALSAICSGSLGRPVVGCSQRRLAELTGHARATVARSLQRLQAAGLLELVAADDAGVDASVYRLHPRSGVVEANSPLRGSVRTCIGLTASAFAAPVPDAFRCRGGLPAGSYQTLQTMPVGDWVKTAELRSLRPSGPALATLRSHLQKLHSTGLVDHDLSRKQFWKRVPEPDLSRTADFLGTAGAHARQQERHAAERAAYAWRSNPSGQLVTLDAVKAAAR